MTRFTEDDQAKNPIYSTGHYLNCFPYKFDLLDNKCKKIAQIKTDCFNQIPASGTPSFVPGWDGTKCLVCEPNGVLTPTTDYMQFNSPYATGKCSVHCGADPACDTLSADNVECSLLCTPLDVCTNYCAGQLDTICVPFPTCSLKCGMSSGDYKKVCYENIATGDYHAVVLRNSTACNFNVFSTDIFVGQPRIKYSITQFLFVTGYSYGDSVPQQTAADGCSFEAWISQNYGDADGSRDFVPLTT